MKKRLCIFIILVAYLFSSCSMEKKDEKIGLLMGLYKAKRWKLERAFFEKRIKELGAIPIVKVSEHDDLKQIKQAEELINEKIDAVVIIASNENNAAAIVRKFHRAGIKVIADQRMIKNASLDAYITFNNKKTGELMAKYAVDKVPKGNYILLWGDTADKSAHDIKQGAINVLTPYIKNHSINIVYEMFVDNWRERDAFFYTNKVIQFSDTKIDAIIAPYSGMAYGAKKAIKKNNLEDKIFVVGHTPDVYSCKQIIAGKDIFVVYRSPKTIAYIMAETANNIAKDKQVNFTDSIFNGKIKVPTIIINPILVTKSNINQTVFEEGFVKKEKVFKKKLN